MYLDIVQFHLVYQLFVSSELICFSFYINACEDEGVEVIAMMTLETSLSDSDLVGVPGSLLAAAALCMAKWILDTSSSTDIKVWNSAVEYRTDYTAEEMMAVMKKLACNILNTDITEELDTDVIQRVNTDVKQDPIKTKYENYKFVQNILHPKQRRHRSAYLILRSISLIP